MSLRSEIGDVQLQRYAITETSNGSPPKTNSTSNPLPGSTLLTECGGSSFSFKEQACSTEKESLPQTHQTICGVSATGGLAAETSCCLRQAASFS